MKKYLIAALMMSACISITTYAGEWKQDQTGYWYEEANGSYAKSSWKLVDGNWYYFDNSGYMLTGWHQESGVWYYLDPESGAMIHDTVQTIDGVSYQFDASGILVEDTTESTETGGNGWNGSTYTSSLLNYQLTVPDSYINFDVGTLLEEIGYEGIVLENSVGRTDNEVVMVGVSFPGVGTVSEADLSTVLADLITGEDSPYTLREKGQVGLGGGTYEYMKLNLAGLLYQDLYVKREGNNVFLLQFIYAPKYESEVVQIVSSIRNIR